MTDTNPQTVLARYEVTGKTDNGTCGYRVMLDDTEVMNCSLSADAIETIATITDMQLDGSYEENKQKLIDAAKTIDPETGQMDANAIAKLDPAFMTLNNRFAEILADQCD